MYEKSQKYQPILYQPVSFNLDIEIYDDKIGQLGDRILSGHITGFFIQYWRNLKNLT